jgi:hypothetical protein
MHPRSVALAVLLTALPVAATTEADGLRVDLDVTYVYGEWRWGAFDMRPQAGLAGPEARLILPGDRWSASLRYLTGDFAAVGAIPLADPLFNSRKNYSLDDRRETLAAAQEFRPNRDLSVGLRQRYARYEHSARIELESDQRLYGEGHERTVAESWAVGAGLRLHRPVTARLSIAADAAWYPWVRSEISGEYDYDMLYRPERLDERWFGRFEPTGWRAGLDISWALASLPATLSAGLLYERFAGDDGGDSGWLADYLAGDSRDWQTDRLLGLTLRAGFSF